MDKIAEQLEQVGPERLTKQDEQVARMVAVIRAMLIAGFATAPKGRRP